MIATQTYALAETLATQFGMNFFIAKVNLDGITHEESLVRAVETGNHINWLVGHVVATRNLLLPSLHQHPVWGDDTQALYRRGSSGAIPASYLPFDEVVRAFRETHERILAGVASLSDEELAAPAPFSPGGGPETLGTLLMKSTVHEGYHLGQTAILRRVVGKEGAIK
ncbi:MAG TPA: DinB family protein [Thermoanaerobaculia bacterium]|nr:DinB family protein [Thermoanaerobaculia bacterium]